MCSRILIILYYQENHLHYFFVWQFANDWLRPVSHVQKAEEEAIHELERLDTVDKDKRSLDLLLFFNRIPLRELLEDIYKHVELQRLHLIPLDVALEYLRHVHLHVRRLVEVIYLRVILPAQSSSILLIVLAIMPAILYIIVNFARHTI